MNQNRVKQAIKEGRTAIGYRLVFPSPWIVEVLGRLDFDYVWIDGEHGPFSLDQIEDICRTAEGVGATPIARVPDIGSSTILRFLDRGVQGIIGPHIATKSDAEQLVNACLFGPEGERSFGGNRGSEYAEIADDEKLEFYRSANKNMLVGALLEDKRVIKELDDILSVPGIDYFDIGHNDFAQSIGYPGESHRQEVQDAMQGIYGRVRGAGARLGIDFMRGEWVTNMLIDAGRDLLSGH